MDGDTVPDGLEQGTRADDLVDANANNIPDRLEPTMIPTASGWVLTTLGATLSIAAKIRLEQQRQQQIYPT